MIVALAGGVGGARLAVGLAQVLPPRELAIVVNTGDDFEHLGLTICPDLDTVMYTLANVHNPAAGWGRASESWQCFNEIKHLGGPGWFQLGDRDMATHVLRSEALRRGEPLSRITQRLAARLGVKHAIVPMSDTPVHTRVHTNEGELAFQDYFVRLRCEPRVRRFRFAGARTATPPPALQRLLRSRKVTAVVICPSNPFVSVAPILAVPAIRAWLKARTFPVVAVSPIIGGAAVKGPAAKMMRELGVTPSPPSALAIAQHYGAWVDRWVIDTQDAALAGKIERLNKPVLITNTLMTSHARSTALAKQVLRLTRP